MKRIVGILMALALLLAVTTAYASGGAEAKSEQAQPAAAGGKTKISVLRPGDEQKVAAFLKPATEKFMQLNPDIEVEPIYESWGAGSRSSPLCSRPTPSRT